MITAHDVIAVAKSQLGYRERPVNQTKYWAELDPALQGAPWCGGFVSWVFKHAGAPLPDMGKPYGFVYCPYAVRWAKANGLFSESGHYAPADIVLYGPGGGSHTGIIVADDGVTMTVIEGNTSADGATGSQTNGGGVHLRHRPHGDWVYGVLQGSKMLNRQPPPEDDMPYSQEQLEDFAGTGVLGARVGRAEVAPGKPLTVGIALDRIYGASAVSAAQITALTAAVKALASAQSGVDGAAVLAAVQAEVRESLADLEITLKTGA